jgi:hypothetical protein
MLNSPAEYYSYSQLFRLATAARERERVDTREIALGERADAELQRLGAAAHETKCWRVVEGPVFHDVRTKGFSSEQGSDDPQSTSVETS